MKNTASLLSLTVSALLLAACGGGSPDVSSTQTAAKGWGTYNLEDDVSEDTYTADKYDEEDIGDIPGERYRIHNIVMTINNKKYTADNPTIDISALPLGLNNLKYQTRLTKTRLSNQAKEDDDEYSATGTLRLYKQQYSVIAGINLERHHSKKHGPVSLTNVEYHIKDAQGLITPFEQLPQTGKFTYTGSAFTANEEGRLVYSVDFDKREGSGSVSGLNSTGDITLHAGGIGKTAAGPLANSGVIVGRATAANHHAGAYDVSFFGPNAEEIAGDVRLYRTKENAQSNSMRIGIAGSREPLK